MMTTLDKLANDLVRGVVTMPAAVALVRRTLAGEELVLGGIPSRVVPSFAVIEAELAAIRAFLESHEYADLHRWAGAFVQVHACLALNLSLAAAELVRRVAATDEVPAGADDYVVAMIDALIGHPERLSTGLESQLLAARRRLCGASTPSGDSFGTIVSLFEHEGWLYYADREAGKLLIQFVSPIGTTRLVCRIVANELTIYALPVGRATAPQMDRIDRELAARFSGVRPVLDGDGGVALHYTLQAADTLSQAEVRQAIVLVNGAAEHLLAGFR